MKGYILTDKKQLKEQEIKQQNTEVGFSKVKITKALISLPDVLKYSGELECDNVVLGQYGIGIVSEIEPNLFNIEKGNRVYIEPNRECGTCYNCSNGDYKNCSDMFIAGEDYNGFLSDFALSPANKLFTLPDSISDKEALFISQISLATAIIDTLDIQKGDYVAVIGANNLGIILSQLLIYYSAVPIVATLDDEDFEIAKKSGIYYVLGKEDNWKDEVSSITSGRMAKKVVYISDCDIPTSKAFNLASYGAGVAYTGTSVKNNSVSFDKAVKKQLDIHCINNGFGNTSSSINLIINKAINFDSLKINTINYSSVEKEFEKMSNDFENNEKFYDTIVEMD